MFGALAYNQEKVDNGEAKVLFSNKMLLDEDGHSSIGGCESHASSFMRSINRIRFPFLPVALSVARQSLIMQ